MAHRTLPTRNQKSIVREYTPQPDQAQQAQIEHEIREELGHARVVVHFHDVERESTIVVGHVRDSY